jgi:hypothetical protein
MMFDVTINFDYGREAHFKTAYRKYGTERHMIESRSYRFVLQSRASVSVRFRLESNYSLQGISD